MKRVLIIAGNLQIGGAEKVARDIALYGDLKQFEYHYVVFGDKIGEYEAQLWELGCKIFHMPEPSSGYGRFLKELGRIMSQNHYHVVHAHTMFNCGWVMWLGKQAGIPVRIAHAHSALDDGKGLMKAVYETVMRSMILHCATDLVACGERAGIRLFGQMAFEKRGNLIPNGIDVDAFRYDVEKGNQIRRRLGIGGRFLIGHVGHLAGVKNQVFLLELMPQVLKKRPDGMLLLLGEGKDRPMLEARIQELGLEDRVIMTGNVSDVADHLSAMDVFVFPSLYEGMPLTILEVQANGLPCVISDRVPRDVFLTDLIHPVSLRQPPEQWVDMICKVKRRETERYMQMLARSGFGVQAAMEKVYRIYRRIKE